MRRPASEKLELIRLVEESDLPVKTTLRQLGLARSTFYGWYERYLVGGVEALQDARPRSPRFWNRIPERIREQVVELALEHTAESPRELACRFTDERRYFLSESSTYRILKSCRPHHQPSLRADKGRRLFLQPHDPGA